MSLGATFSKVKNWAFHAVAVGQLITGQNPASPGPAAKLLIDHVKQEASSSDKFNSTRVNQKMIKCSMY